jgi:hypothetical protein
MEVFFNKALRRVFCIGLLLPALSNAQDLPAETDASPRASYVIFQLDNDLFTNSDRDYTSGSRLAWLQPIPEESMNRFQGWLKELSGASQNPVFGRLTTFIEPETIRYDWGTGLTQLMFTPDDPTLPAAPPGDRPYAGWLGIELSLHAKDTSSLSSVIFSIGTTGPNAFAEEAQEWVHRNISNSPIYQGWDSQVPGELTLNLNIDSKRRLAGLASASADWLLELDGYIEWGTALGNFRTDAYVGALMRAGYNLPVQYMTPRVQLGSYSHELFLSDTVEDNGWSLYAFGGARGSAVAHDITLDGPVFRDYDAAVSSEPWVGELVAGIGLRFHDLTLTFSRTFRSKEFESQASSHQFGSVLVSLGF